ncbi:hypothetical protein SCA6_015045 [Theobroma cacao]
MSCVEIAACSPTFSYPDIIFCCHPLPGWLSPHNSGDFDFIARSVAHENYQLKDEDFPHLAFPFEGRIDGGRTYNEKSSH